MRMRRKDDAPRGRSVYVTPATWRKWVREAKREGISVAEALRQAMDAWLQRREAARRDRRP